MLAPSCGQLVTIEVMDRDKVGRDEVIDTLTLPFDALLAGTLPRLGWWHLYGAPRPVEEPGRGSVLLGQLGARGALKAQGADGLASEWRGKLLLQLGVQRHKASGLINGLLSSVRGTRGAEGNMPEKLMQRRLTQRVADPPKLEYEMQARYRGDVAEI